ncbi:hypothetical protein FE784_00560 [Paenibacillus hemerocallicola]|uniref:Uncharacterized protein n=1 Tax=Paenibacillus hemerocallicola TaxID=1172614 RepID=A0A5C4TGK3_9BACL|nr:hypothetical protein [Paenibacillus hemerocallicola]TNJ68191.1 hypothetical protein FE784_00560 [Paenibacillus hemerocallicola]
MNGIAKLIHMAVSIPLRAPFIVSVSAQSGCGVDVAIFRKIDDAGEYKTVEQFRAVDHSDDRLHAALVAVQSVSNGTYAGGGERVAT